MKVLDLFASVLEDYDNFFVGHFIYAFVDNIKNDIKLDIKDDYNNLNY